MPDHNLVATVVFMASVWSAGLALVAYAVYENYRGRNG